MATAGARLPTTQLLGLIPSKQKLGLMVALAAITALVVAGWLWGQSPDYRVLYANLSDRDGGAVIASLQQMNVPFKFTEGGGALLVPANQVHEMRLRLAGQGLPKGGLVGFELMEAQKFGTSQFQEQVNYQRALEGELARSIQSLSAVNGARVHLAFSKPSVFVREQQKPSASVLLSLHPGRNLDPGQVSAIVHLVSSSIPDLSVKNVTVIDQSGSLLTSSDASIVGLDPGQLRYRREVEQGFAKRIEAILAPIAGNNNVVAQVTADIDFTLTENLAEIFTPNPAASAAVRSQQSTEASNSGGVGGAGATGVPGALSNQPAAPANAPLVAASAPAASASAVAAAAAAANTRRDSTINYEVDKTIRHTRQSVGGIKRLSVAVLVNHRKQVDEEGKVTTKPLEPEEIEQINALVKEVMGFSKERGDSLNVTNSAFSVAEVEPIVEVPLWKQPATLAMAKDIGRYVLIAALLVYLVFGILRPLLSNLNVPDPNELRQLANDTDAEAPARRPEAPSGNLDAVKQLARSEPQLVASVVKEWVNKDG